MAYNDKKFGHMFPTRHGGASGSANERAMLDRLGSSEGYRKQWRLNADGSTTRLDTRNGAPRFITTRPEVMTTEEVVTSAYLETGQLEMMMTAPEHPDRGKPAKWHFIGIGTEEDYLGKIRTTEKQLGQQKNKPALSDGMDSLAIGYPRSDDPAEDVRRREEYFSVNYLRTLAAGLFPASLWSGAMRLFMQAQYGIKGGSAMPALRPDVVGTEIVLRYYTESGESIQMGLWAHHSPGIFSVVNDDGKPVGKFWLITITNPTGGQFIATSYKLKFDTTGKAILRQYKRLAKLDRFTPVERSKLEAYLYAHSMIDVANPRVVGGFAGAPGGAMAYGWKFNSTGSKASIVLHELRGTGAQDLRWNSSTVHVDFAHSFDLQTKTDVLSLTAQTINNGEWTDGWGAYNIFVPLEDVGTDALGHASLAVNQVGVMPPFAFSVPVYGFYKDDVWQVVTMSRMIEPGPWPKYTQQNSMPYPNPNVPDTVQNRYYHDAKLANQGFNYTSLSKTQSSLMNLQIGSRKFAGVSDYGTHFRYDLSVGGGGFGPPGNTVGYLTEVMSNDVMFDVVGVYGHPPGFPVPPELRWDNVYYFSASLLEQTIDTYSWEGWRFHSWTLVIPAGDCEAVFVGTHEYDSAVGTVTHIHTSGGQEPGQLMQDGYVVTPYSGYRSSWYVDNNSTPVSVTDAALPPGTTAEIYCFNTRISGTQGAYHASSTPLFIVDKSYPFYMSGMGSITSYGGRYAITEGLASSLSVSYNRRFVGWA